MKKTFAQNLSSILFFCLIITGCIPYAKESNICLQPVVSTGYPYHVEQNAAPQGIQKEIPKIWEPQLSNTQLEKMSHRIVSVDIVSSKDSIWYASQRDVVKYQIASKEMEVYNLSPMISEYGSISNLLVDSTNTVWVTISGLDGSPIARFDSAANSFVLINFLDENNTPLSLKNQDIYSPPPRVYDLESGQLLLFLDQRLWLLDTNKLTARNLLEKPLDMTIYNVEVGKDKKIWLVAKYTQEQMKKSGIADAQVYQFDEGRLKQIIESVPDSSNDLGFPLTLDKENKLWISNLGWIEQLNDNNDHDQPSVFYKLIESPLFVQEGGRTTYGYYRAKHVYGSMSGNIWFSSVPGIIRLNPESGNWCMLARGIDAKVTETTDGSIWFADGQLYKYSP